MAKIDKQAVFEFLARIPKGKVVTYGMIGIYLGDKNLARSIGNMLHENPDWLKYPCYKVVKHDGRLSESYTFGGIEMQKNLLIADGVEVDGYKVNLKKYCWQY